MPESFNVSIAHASAEQLRDLEKRSPVPLASDACVIVRFGERVIGWGDDYGSFHLPTGPSSDSRVERAGEALLEAAVNFWVAEAR